MKYLSELRADHRAATHRELHCRRSVFQGALYATSPWAVLVLRLLSTRPMQFSIVRSILHGFSEFSKLSVEPNVAPTDMLRAESGPTRPPNKETRSPNPG